jgi:hypothetical protein
MSGAYDTSRFTRQGDSVHTWIRFQNTEPEELPDSSGTYDVVEAEFFVRCADLEVADGQMIITSMGDSVGGFRPDSSAFRPFKEQGIGRILMAVCNRTSDDVAS